MRLILFTCISCSKKDTRQDIAILSKANMDQEAQPSGQQGDVPEEVPQQRRPAAAAAQLTPTDRDVLFGRGRAYVNHGGNRALHALAEEYRPLYKAFGNKVTGIVERKQKHNGMGTKQEIVNAIIATLQQEKGARFLRRRDDTTEQWVEVDMSEAQAKVSHLLRSQSKKEVTSSRTSNDHVAGHQPRRSQSPAQASLVPQAPTVQQDPSSLMASARPQLPASISPSLLYPLTQSPFLSLSSGMHSMSPPSDLQNRLNAVMSAAWTPPLDPRFPSSNNPMLAAAIHQERIRRLDHLDRLREANSSSTAKDSQKPPK